MGGRSEQPYESPNTSCQTHGWNPYRPSHRRAGTVDIHRCPLPFPPLHPRSNSRCELPNIQDDTSGIGGHECPRMSSDSITPPWQSNDEGDSRIKHRLGARKQWSICWATNLNEVEREHGGRWWQCKGGYLSRSHMPRFKRPTNSHEGVL